MSSFDSVKRKTQGFVSNNKYFVYTLFMLVMFSLIPLLLMETTRGHDYAFHLQRINALSQEISAGNHFPHIYSTTLNGNGYASPLFYGDLFLRIPAYLMVWFGVSLTDAYAFFVAFISAATVLSMYFCTVSITKSQKAGFCGAIMFGLSSYLVTDLIHRAALGEAQSFIFLPIAFAGLYHILYGEIKKWYLLPLGLSAMIYCHTLSAFVTAVVFGVFFLMSLGKIKESPKRLIYIGLSALVFFGLSAYFLFPMLEQMDSTKFLATDGSSAIKWGTLSENTTPWWIIFYDFGTVFHKIDGYSPNGVGFAVIALLIIYIRNYKKTKDVLLNKLLILSGIILFILSDLFPWHLLQNLCGILQFPWRLLMYPTFFIAMGAAIYFGNTEDKLKSHSTLMMYVVAFSLLSYFVCGISQFIEYTNYKFNDTKIEYDYVNRIGSGEYLPSTDDIYHDTSHDTKYKKELLNNSEKIFSDGNPKTSFNREFGKLTVEFYDMNKDNAYLEVPLLMYKGYNATLEDGTELDCYYGTYNRIRVNVGERRDGTVTFEYVGTTVQKVSGVVSVMTLLGLVGYLVLLKRIKQQ